MPRVIIEREGEVRPDEDHDAATDRVLGDAAWVNDRVRELAGARVMPYLVEEETAVTLSDPDADGVRRYTVRAVMNTAKGNRLILKAGGVRR